MTTDPIKALVETAQKWCDAVDRGTSWDYWDHHFKDMKYKVLPAAIEALKRTDVVMVKRKDIETWAECLDAMARGSGGWAWEDVHDEMVGYVATPPAPSGEGVVESSETTKPRI